MIVAMHGAVSQDGQQCTAYIGGNGCHGFNTNKRREAHQFDEYDAKRYAEHFKYWYRGFPGGAAIEVLPA